MKRPKWGGRRAQAWTREVLARGGLVCTLSLPGCTTVATTGDHIVPRSVDPSREYDVTNGRPACLHCNSSRNDGKRDAPVVVDARAFFESGREPGRQADQSPPRASEKTGEPQRWFRFESDGGQS
jgi:5-methylcytosine-specific restriction endonuclease McrA